MNIILYSIQSSSKIIFPFINPSLHTVNVLLLFNENKLPYNGSPVEISMFSDCSTYSPISNVEKPTPTKPKAKKVNNKL